ncbi:MAG: hypothetical protein CML17_08145 [Pusillimonas sp.]|mgnify:CR=1 FL=1|jgi:hypothetical protein|nr:hypothetical protein [Pusillimonas sp.]
MAFLDNSGDIILDAVLTDTGRLRMARGDGSFKITKFAFGDDEIDYSSYNGDHLSGSAYYDLEILQTPIFEAFTNNTSMMKSKLITLTNNNLLFLPIIKQNTLTTATKQPASGDAIAQGIYTLFVNNDTKIAAEAFLGIENISNRPGFINGFNSDANTTFIRVDQGLDTIDISPSFTIDPELKETQYLVELDSRLLSIYDKSSLAVASESFLDDDQIASYYFTQGAGTYINELDTGTNDDGNLHEGDQNISGPRGTRFEFGLRAALDAASSDFLFNTIGTTLPTTNSQVIAFIDTNIRITGVTTGYQIDIPIRVIREQNT